MADQNINIHYDAQTMKNFNEAATRASKMFRAFGASSQEAAEKFAWAIKDLERIQQQIAKERDAKEAPDFRSIKPLMKLVMDPDVRPLRRSASALAYRPDGKLVRGSGAVIIRPDAFWLLGVAQNVETKELEIWASSPFSTSSCLIESGMYESATALLDDMTLERRPQARQELTKRWIDTFIAGKPSDRLPESDRSDQQEVIKRFMSVNTATT